MRCWEVIWRTENKVVKDAVEAEDCIFGDGGELFFLIEGTVVQAYGPGFWGRAAERPLYCEECESALAEGSSHGGN